MSDASVVRWGILGVAKIATGAVIPAIERSRNGKVAAVASRDLTKAQRCAVEFHIPQAYGEYESLLESDAIDAVYIPLPNSLHGEWTVRAAQAGKHILCEKPLTANADEAVNVVQACREAGALLMEAFMYRLHPQHARIQKAIRDGILGTIRHIQAEFSFPLEEREHEICIRKDLAGGAMMDVGCYAVDVCRRIAGADPLEVSAQCWFHPESGCDENSVGTMRFPNDILATFRASFCSLEVQRYEVRGDRGTAVCGIAFNPAWDVDCAIEIHTSRCHERILIPGCNPYQLEVEAFGDAILHGIPLPWFPEDSIANMRVLDAVYRSAREGRTIAMTG